MTRFERHLSDRELSSLRPLPDTEGKATFAVSAAVLDALGLAPEQAAHLDLGDVFRLIREEGA
ncbi:hypothetical protein KVH27_19105 [Streptomyces olivaceus]|uniref:hypothetical protein n=1 Tax=Streptomyces olivaceus TaxID=47716 RepID=UPI001CC97D30|nr:hypothetical protein [Streptomyces olivaceus]MBZ6250476.1 hypothetical protein [Streptomyces olivaceus]